MSLLTSIESSSAITSPYSGVLACLLGLSTLACGLGPLDPLTEDTEASTQLFVADVGPPLESEATIPALLEPKIPPCEQIGYPCSVNDIEPDVLSELDVIADEIATALEAGESLDGIVETLLARDGMNHAWHDQGVIVFEFDGAPPLPFFSEGAGRLVSPDPGGLLAGVLGDEELGSEASRSSSLVAFKTPYARPALLADPSFYDVPHNRTAEVRDILKKAPMFERGDLKITKNNSRPGPSMTDSEFASVLTSFTDWRNYPYVDIGTHGVAINNGGRPFVAYTLTTSFSTNEQCSDWIREMPNNFGVFCAWVNGTGGTSPVLLISLDGLYVRNSAPLVKTVMYSGACNVGRRTNMFSVEPGLSFLMDAGSMIGWDNTVSSSSSDAASVAFAKWTVEQGLRTGDAYDKVEPKVSRRPGKVANLKLRGRDDVRAREIVHFATRSGKILAPSDTDLLVFEQRGSDGWVAELAVRIDGVMPSEVGAFNTTLEASSWTSWSSITFEPETINPMTPGSSPVDELGHRYMVPVEMSTGQTKPASGTRFMLEATTQLPEGGVSSSGSLIPSIGAMSSRVSEGAGNYVASTADCAFGHIQARAGSGAGDFNLNKVKTDAGGGSFRISGALAQRDEDAEIVEERAPSFVISVVGSLPAEGQTRTYQNSQIFLVTNTSNSNPFASYTTEGDTGEGRGNVSLVLTRRDNGTYEGKLRGSAIYPDPGAEDEFSASSMNIVFLSGPIDDNDIERFQCF